MASLSHSESLSFSSMTLNNVDDVKSLVSESGVTFVLITNPKHYIPKSSFHKGDPDIAYLYYNPRFPIPPDDRDATFFWKGRTRLIYWGQRTKASLRKVLIEDSTSECAVCFDKIGVIDAQICPQCDCRCCLRCKYKMMTKEIAAAFIHGDYMMDYTCIQCRFTIEVDAAYDYFRVMDRLDDFSNYQKAALLQLKNSDPGFYKFQIKHYKGRKKFFREMSRKQFKAGSVVRLSGLKKKEWNGKKAMIIGGKVVKDNVIRWPIRLMDKSNGKALLKQCNLQKFGKKKR